jgi:membrane-associated phospholipid phosphatase
MKTRFLLAGLITVLCAPVHAQPDSTCVHGQFIQDLQLALDGAVHVCTSPARWETSDWLLAGAACGVTAGASALDVDLRSVMRRNQGSADVLADAARIYGEQWVALGVTIGLYGAGSLFEDSWLRETAVLTGTALILSSAGTAIIKRVVGRARPYLNAGNHTFDMFSFDDGYNSFPSGHTAAAFSLSSVLASRIDHPLATIALYGAACLTALSRMYTDEHWFSDVVFGGLAATAIGRSLVLWHEDRKSDRQSLRIIPGAGRVLVVYTF